MPKKQRYHIIDMLRGFALINMVLYHALWDIVYIFGARLEWYTSRGAFVWQQCICCTFILLSGFCWSMGSKKLKRGLTVFAASAVITLVTLVFMPENLILFGVLSLIGSASLIMILLDKVLSKLNSYVGIVVSLLLFVLTRNINAGYLGFGAFSLYLPRFLYSNLFTAYLGFPSPSFASEDYFPIFPWLFLYFTGYFLYRIFERNGWLRHFRYKTVRPLEFCGRHSLLIYMLHQPVVYAVLSAVFFLLPNR